MTVGRGVAHPLHVRLRKEDASRPKAEDFPLLDAVIHLLAAALPQDGADLPLDVGAPLQLGEVVHGDAIIGGVQERTSRTINHRGVLALLLRHLIISLVHGVRQGWFSVALMYVDI